MGEITSSVMTSSQKNTTSSFVFSDDMTSCRSTQDSILADQELFHPICSTDFGNQLHNFWVPVSSVTTNYEEAAWDAFRN
jgi:hypothetical protein